MRNFARTALIIAAPMLIILPALAADLSMDSTLGKTEAQVRESLAGMGYEVRKTETERGKIEVYFVGNGRKGEVYVSTETGKPTKIEMK